MLNPDRAEFESKLSSIPENSKKNGHIPRWLRVPAFAIRTSLAILTATPGMVVAVDAINRIENSAIVYDSGQNITINPQHEFNQPLPLPTETPQPPIVYRLYLEGDTAIVYRDFRTSSNYIDNWGKTHIILRAGQNLEISATGRVYFYHEIYSGDDPYGKSCNDSRVFDPDGNSYLRDGTMCPPRQDRKTMLMGNIGEGGPWGSGMGMKPKIPVGSYWKGHVDRDAVLTLWVDTSLNGSHGGFDIIVNVYPLNPIPTSVPLSRPVFTPEPIKTTVPTEKGSDLPGWLLGAGAIFLAALAVDRLYRRWKIGKGTTTASTTGAAGGTSSSAAPIPRIRGIAGAIGGPSNPNTAPSTGPAQPKNPEWIIGQVDFKRRWQVAKSKLPPIQPGDNGNMQGYVLDRFKAGMNVVHEVSLDDTTNVSEMNTRVRAGIEYLIPEIWSDNRIFKSFFDPGFNAGYLTPEDLAKIIFLPESYRNLSSFTKDQKREVNSIRRILLHALHPDLLKSDADPKLQDYIDELLKKINPAWPYIDRLIK